MLIIQNVRKLVGFPAFDLLYRLLRSNVPYIGSERLKGNVREYRHKGVCLSYTYRYFYSPICEWIVSRLPLWLA